MAPGDVVVGSLKEEEMRISLVLLLVVSLLSLGAAQTLEFESARPRAGQYALEGLAGLVALGAGTGLAFVIGDAVYDATYDPNETGWFANLDAAVGGIVAGGLVGLSLPAVSGLTVSSVSHSLDGYGSQAGAIAGAYIGAVAGVGIGFLGYQLSDRSERQSGAYEPLIRIPALALGALLVPTCAVVGCSVDHPRELPIVRRDSDRFGLPAVALGCVRDADGAPQLSVDARLLSCRF
jgi:hypothetical protein